MQDLEDLEHRVSELEAWQSRKSSDAVMGQCTAGRPHPNQLVYLRGPNQYHCTCGAVYVKDGAGGLKEVA